MNKQLHRVPPVPAGISNLDITYLSGQHSKTFVFEPKGLVDFKTAWDWQREWQQRLLEDETSPQAIWLLEHMNCYTLGRGADEANLLFDSRYPPEELFRIDRGGEVTYHLPGQLVAYLVLDLRTYKTDLNWYLRQLEQVAMDVLQNLGLPGKRMNGLTGIWCNGYKVASIGIGCRRWITQHGLALNVDCDLKGFDQIIPCGLKKSPVGRLSNWIPELKVSDVKPILKQCLNTNLGLEPETF